MLFWNRIKEFTKRYNANRALIEFDENRFVLKWDRWPILKPRCQLMVYWDKVRRIDVCMWDAFAGHAVGLLFDYGNKKWACVSEVRKGYEEFIAYVMERFPNFNQHNFQEIEKCFPSDISFPCWDRDKPVDDLDARPEDRIIVWKKDGSTFAGGSDD